MFLAQVAIALQSLTTVIICSLSVVDLSITRVYCDTTNVDIISFSIEAAKCLNFCLLSLIEKFEGYPRIRSSN